MKTLKLIDLKFNVPGVNKPDTLYLINECLNNTPEGGYSYEDLKNRQRIEKACEKAKATSIQFEDNDASNLQDIVQSMRWAMRHDDIMNFCKDVENMK